MSTGNALLLVRSHVACVSKLRKIKNKLKKHPEGGWITRRGLRGAAPAGVGTSLTIRMAHAQWHVIVFFCAWRRRRQFSD